MTEFVEKLIDRLEKASRTMMPVIPTEEAIKIVNQLAEEYKHCALCYLGSPCEYQNEEARLSASQFVNDCGWILCSERLPEERVPVIVCATGSEEGVFISYYVEEKDKWQYDTEDGYVFVNVIAWQPLPAPYQPKGE